MLNKSIILNVHEIEKEAKRDYSAQIVLLFCLAIGTGKIISTSIPNLKHKLNLGYIPEYLFTKGNLLKFPNKIVSNFEIKEPQCYMTNASWLHYNIALKTKIDYLKILGQRSISNKNRFVPEHYVDSCYWKNPLIRHVDRKIYFILEK